MEIFKRPSGFYHGTKFLRVFVDTTYLYVLDIICIIYIDITIDMYKLLYSASQNIDYDEDCKFFEILGFATQ